MKKGKLYEVWSRNARDVNTLTTTDKLVHARKRRALSSVFSEKSIQSTEKFILKHVNRWCELLVDGNGNWSHPKNVSLLVDCLMLDTLGDLCFGKSLEIKEAGENSFRHIPHTIA